jgi:hypothetical protein
MHPASKGDNSAASPTASTLTLTPEAAAFVRAASLVNAVVHRADGRREYQVDGLNACAAYVARDPKAYKAERQREALAWAAADAARLAEEVATLARTCALLAAERATYRDALRVAESATARGIAHRGAAGSVPVAALGIALAAEEARRACAEALAVKPLRGEDLAGTFAAPEDLRD